MHTNKNKRNTDKNEIGRQVTRKRTLQEINRHVVCILVGKHEAVELDNNILC